MGEAATRPHRLGYEIIVLRLLARRQQGEIGPDLFRAACDMGLEGLVSKRRDRPYQADPSKHWLHTDK
jgi:ATP-dependent DNA ligase